MLVFKRMFTFFKARCSINSELYKARVFVNFSNFHSSLLFAGKAGHQNSMFPPTRVKLHVGIVGSKF